jgi:hypothetical protein
MGGIMENNNEKETTEKERIIEELIADHTNTTWENLGMVMAEYVRRRPLFAGKSDTTVELKK